ncbi:hypothetical protein BJ684DRAFT_17211 [Piptocephalis cylindrospora]|uniref:Uncharacterized protein n=1 Tax=Piptocephalis cylindrospora TaxID=1907219 RepID=A0A4P9Y0H3_9FUNG|nr:hypothetical protein BJ684DRAFT_17211 [Piptocephalis cylindrospora]|eukprot:RKP12286.1 hypothetical protein BJ684DRAFT_17211 [Piptocephalis cylindrospora]
MKLTSILLISVMLAMPLIVAAAPASDSADTITGTMEDPGAVWNGYTGSPGNTECSTSSECNDHDKGGTGYLCAIDNTGSVKKGYRATCVGKATYMANTDY